MLAWFCKKIIELYWHFVPREKRKVCLFKETCSNHVYKKFEKHGFLDGCYAFIYRYKNCNNDYSFYTQNEKVNIVTSQNVIIPESRLNEFVARACRTNLQESKELVTSKSADADFSVPLRSIASR